PWMTIGRPSFTNSVSTVSNEAGQSRYVGILLLLPFAFNCAAALVRAYPYGGTRHSAFLMPFALAGVAVGLARVLPGRTVVGVVISLLASLLCNLFPSKRLPYMSAETQRKSNMTAAITLLRQLPAGQPIFTDYQTSLSLGHYLCDQHPIADDWKVTGFFSYE